MQAQRQHYMEHLWASFRVPYALGGLLARWTLVLRQWRDSPSAEAAFQAHAPMQFYDTWVARDADGGLLEKHAPFARRATPSLRVVLCAANSASKVAAEWMPGQIPA